MFQHGGIRRHSDPATSIPMTIWMIIDKYGLPLAMLAMVLFVGVKWVLPFMVKQLDEANARLETSTRVFDEALKRRDQEFEKLGDRIATRLDRQDERTEKVRERFGEQLGRVEDEMKRRKR